MKKFFYITAAFLVCSSHDMYLKLDTHFLSPGSQAVLKLFNGTFERSDNVITRDRMADVSMVGQGRRDAIDTAKWSDDGKETYLTFETKDPGTWMVGVSTFPRNIELTAEEFNEYLEHDGVLDMLEWRKDNNAMEEAAVERYAKHVKTIFQVGNKLSSDWKTTLGYPLEFVPLENPFGTHSGHDLKFELLWQGNPLPNQLVYVGIENLEKTHDDGHAHDHGHSHDHDNSDHRHHDAQQMRTDADGVLTLPLTQAGTWYLRTIYLTHSESSELTHESNWATLTFAIGGGHDYEGRDHDHGDDHHHHHDSGHVSGIPSYVYWLGSLVLIVGLFFWFNRRSE